MSNRSVVASRSPDLAARPGLAGLAGLAVSLAIAGVGCGGSHATAAPGPTGPADGKERPAGTTGLPGLDWGAGVDEISALYVDAEPVDVGVQWKGSAEREPATIVFTVDGDGLSQVAIAWDLAFDSMTGCGEALHRIRPAIDRRLGDGAEENLGVFWETPTASVVLSCNPGDDDGASLSQTYSRKVAE